MKFEAWDGKRVNRPCCLSGVPLSVYHSQDICEGPSVSSSGLRRALEINGGSPAHFYSEWSGNPNQIERADTKALLLGNAAHFLVLGQPHFARSYAIRPDEMMDSKTGEMKPWQGNRTVCKEWIEETEASGRVVLTPDDVEIVKGMSISLGNHPLVRSGLLGGKVERSLFWKDEETGIYLKSRPDALPTDSGDFSDLKSCQSVVWKDLVRSISDYAYHQQAGLVREGSKACLGLEMASFSLVFVEKKPPYCTRVVMLKDEDILLGHKQNHEALGLIAKCMKEGKWPGPGDDHVTHIELSEYYRKKASEEVS